MQRTHGRDQHHPPTDMTQCTADVGHRMRCGIDVQLPGAELGALVLTGAVPPARDQSVNVKDLLGAALVARFAVSRRNTPAPVADRRR